MSDINSACLLILSLLASWGERRGAWAATFHNVVGLQAPSTLFASQGTYLSWVEQLDLLWLPAHFYTSKESLGSSRKGQ